MHRDLSCEPTLQRLYSRACGRVGQDSITCCLVSPWLGLYFGASLLVSISPEQVKATALVSLLHELAH